MQRDVETIAGELREIAHMIALRAVTGEDRERLVLRFHMLREEQKQAKRARSVWRVYFMHAPGAGLVKIGATSNLNSRLMALQNGSPLPLVLLGCIDGDRAVERELHKRWATLRAHGEWFQASDDLMDFIRTACA